MQEGFAFAFGAAAMVIQSGRLENSPGLFLLADKPADEASKRSWEEAGVHARLSGIYCEFFLIAGPNVGLDSQVCL